MPCLLTAGAGGALQTCTRSLPQGTNSAPALQPLPSLPRRPSRGTGLVFGLRKDGRIRPLQRLDGTVELWNPRFYCCHAESQGSAPVSCRGSSPGSGTGSTFSQGSSARRCLGHISKEQCPLLAIRTRWMPPASDTATLVQPKFTPVTTQA